MTTWYTGGALSISHASLTFSLATGAMLSQVRSGDTLQYGTTTAVIASVESNTNATLVLPWPDVSVFADTQYLILRTGDGWQTNVSINEQLADIIRTLEAGQGLKPDATGTLTDRATHDTAAQGFIFVRTDTIPFQVYIKATATSGDWAGPSSFGQGAPGPQGRQGGDRYDVFVWDNGLPADGDTLLKAKFTTDVIFPVGLTASRAGADVAATATTVFSLKKDGVQFGTVTYAAGGTTGVFAAASDTTFVAGSLFTVVAPSPYDATLRGVYMTVTGTRP